MPAIAFPDLLPESVEVTRLAAQAVSRSPASLVEQVYDWGGRAWRIVVRMQRMNATDAAIMGAWIEDLDGRVGTFNFDLDPWLPGYSAAPGSVEFRLETVPTWKSDYTVTWSLEFSAVEVVT